MDFTLGPTTESGYDLGASAMPTAECLIYDTITDKCFMKNGNMAMVILDDTCIKTSYYGPSLSQMHAEPLKDMISSRACKYNSWLAVRNPVTNEKYVANKLTKLCIRDKSRNVSLLV